MFCNEELDDGIFMDHTKRLEYEDLKTKSSGD